MDTCVSTVLPDISKFKLFKNLTAVMVFTEYVHLDKPLKDLLTFELYDGKVKGSLVAYDFEPFDTKKFDRIQFNFTFKRSLHGTEVFLFSFKRLLNNMMIDSCGQI